MEPRLKAGMWVGAAVRLSDGAGRPAAVLRRGDPDSGGVLCVLRDREGRHVVLAQARDGTGREAWIRGTGAEPVEEAVANAYVERATRRDPDLWVVEFDAPDLLPPFEARLL